MAKERIIWLDNLKAFLIMIVVLGHTIIFTGNWSDNIAYRFISSFWMPSFMFTSGFSSFRSLLEWNMVKRRFFQLMVPFTVWSAILCAIKGTYHLEQMFLYPTQSVWFLFALFFITFIHVVTIKVATRLKIKEELLVCIVADLLWATQKVTKIDYFCFGLISYHFVFYSLGFYARKYYTKVISLKPIWYYMLAVVFCFMAFFRDESYLSIIHLPSSLYIIYDALCAFMSLAPFVYSFGKYANKSMKITQVGGYIGDICIPYNNIHYSNSDKRQFEF